MNSETCNHKQHRWLLNCLEVTRLISESKERKLGFMNRIKIKLHLFICGPCVKFQKITRLPGQLQPFARQEPMPEEMRNRIFSKVDSQ
ncbi:MAG: hypothetical protein KDK38_01515 [Leptospiraceae bacterium]|nr:hypothetical protein [Leptospiraceae bacterium]